MRGDPNESSCPPSKVSPSGKIHKSLSRTNSFTSCPERRTQPSGLSSDPIELAHCYTKFSYENPEPYCTLRVKTLQLMLHYNAYKSYNTTTTSTSATITSSYEQQDLDMKVLTQTLQSPHHSSTSKTRMTLTNV
jgi:hypothetical protein